MTEPLWSQKNIAYHGLTSLRFAYTRGVTVRGPLFAIKSINNKRRSSYRVAVVVSKKVSKSAVVRNRIRRRLYEIIRSQDSLITEPHDIIITVFSERVATEKADTISAQLKRQLKAAKII